MQFVVQEVALGKYVIVPEHREPLPARFDDRMHAQRIADRLRVLQSTRADAAASAPHVKWAQRLNG